MKISQHNSMLERLISFIRHIRNFYFNGFASKSYAQEGEDLILSRIFGSRSSGFYVDVGAHHPLRFSNTYHFYQKGWSGINLEPNPDTFKLFKKFRPKDINLNYGIAENKNTLEYFMFDEPALNTFDAQMLKSRLQNTNYKHINTIHINVLRLEDVFNDVLPVNQDIDFLTIDVEGLDLDVLKSNNWEKYRPHWVLVEQLNLHTVEHLDFDIHIFMKSVGYSLFAKTYNTLFYKKIES